MLSKSFQRIYVVRGKVKKENKLANKKCAGSYFEVNESGPEKKNCGSAKIRPTAYHHSQIGGG